MNLNIDYEKSLDFGHCESMNEAREKLSQITNLLNQVIAVRQDSKKAIFEALAAHPGEKIHKLSWENKMVRLAELSGTSELVNLWQDADTAYRRLKNKQDQIVEDLWTLKKIAEVTPR